MKHVVVAFTTAFFCTQVSGQNRVDTSRYITTTSLALDLDGAPHCYHPNNEGLLHNLNGGIKKNEAIANRFSLKKNNAYGIAKKTSRDGTYQTGYIQTDGYFVSQTPVYDRTKQESDPARYADALTIPYIALSPKWKARGMKACDIVYVRNLTNGTVSAAIFGDWRGNDDNSEISLALANALKIPVTQKEDTSYTGQKVMRYKGIANHRLKIYYFKKSGDGNGKSAEQIQAIGAKLMGYR